MVLPTTIVLANGTLNDQLILKKETLYKGMNGRFVERFYLTPTKSYIFKPLTNNGQLGKEAWIHEHVLPLFPPIFPKIIAYKISDHPDLNWMILEDLGTLSHEFNEESILDVIKWVAWWHSLPLEKLANIPITGLKPQIEEIVLDIRLMKDEFMALVPGLNVEEKIIEHIYKLLDRNEFSNKLVLSHGDLHSGNFAAVEKGIVVLDWEHAHLNLAYWDLYHLIDMSHPLFPKKMTSQFRQRVLENYLEQVVVEVERDVFIKEYYLFSAVFSIWMILLIQKDLKVNDGNWSKNQLENQLKETVSSLMQCSYSLYSI
ncbi:MAG: aminoglycoside phosphotransferase family protein [Bacillus sp. (in: Bacteria)]|nr:aminoglycoside phosphotransferase family protein [Bacillus sp. (in: firmicutes)]